ncbi:MAG: class I SAM-dependent methyltransferase [Magnetospiraceae bacterium]
MDVKEEDILGPAVADHWYYRSKGAALLDFLPADPVDSVLDVGAGSGVFSKRLLEAGRADQAICVDPAYPEEREETHHGHALLFRHQAPPGDHRLILMMDVLEHVADDLALLHAYANALPPGGRVLITVPAFQFLWSGHDEFLEHYRRYTLAQVENLVSRAGLRVVKGRYLFGALFPLIAALRLAHRISGKKPESDLKPAAGWVNRMLIGVHWAEQRLLFPVNRWAGLTVFCLAERDPSFIISGT